ncbi:MAG: HNH endonuclease [Flavobacteriales bacterium]
MPNVLPDHLRLNRANGKAPHKPILLLAILRAFDEGLIIENRIIPSAELVNLFRGYWDALVEPGTFQPRFFLPFYHLKNERSKLWTLHALPGFEHAGTSSRSIKSLGALIAFEAYATLRPDVFQRWCIAEHRAADRLLLMAAYFPGQAVPNELSDTLRKFEHQIAHLSREAYVAQQLQRAQEEEEEEQVLRSAAFRRKVPELYDHRCAITGLQVRHGPRASLIDACHIVPWADSYDDTISNGLALCPNLHRAFDRGLVSVAKDYTVLISPHLQENDNSHAIRPFSGRRLLLPAEKRHWPAPENLAQHRARFRFDHTDGLH